MKNIFLDFLNPDYLRAISFSDDFVSLEQKRILEQGVITSFLLTDKLLLLPPTFYIESCLVRDICEKYKILVEIDVLKFPMRDRSFKALFEKKVIEYKNVMHHYAGMEEFLRERDSRLSFLSTARIPRLSKVGDSILTKWESGPDEDAYWRSKINGNYTPEEVELLRASPRRVSKKGFGITWGEVFKEHNQFKFKLITQILAQRYYTKVYINEYDAAILSNFPFLHDLFWFNSNSTNYDYQLFWQLVLHTGLTRYFHILDPQQLVAIKYCKGFLALRNIYEKILDHKDGGFFIKLIGVQMQGDKGIASSIKELNKSIKSVEFTERFNYTLQKIARYYLSILDKRLYPSNINSRTFMKNTRMESIVVFVALGEEEKILNKSLNCQESSDSKYLHATYDDANVTLFSPGQMGRVPAAVSTMQYLSKVEQLPNLILIVGIAGGFLNQGVRIQDVLVPTHVYDMASTKAYEEDGSVRRNFRTIPYGLDTKISTYINSTRFDKKNWAARASEYARCNEEFVPKIVTSPISSGDEVVANDDWSVEASKIHPKMCGVEMEAGGVCAAAEKFNVPVAMIRGVSDHANPAKSDDEGRKKAMYIASHLAKELIENYRKWRG